MASEPIDWERIELDYRAGVKTLREIAGENGVSHTAINKRAKRDGWARDLSEKITAKVDELVSRAVVSKQVSTETRVTERETVEANAEAIASVILSHRKDISRNRSLANKMLAELEAAVDDPEEFQKLGELMFDPDDKGMDKLNDLYKKVTSLPSRVDSAKKLAETLKVLIGLEREAFRIDSQPEKQDNPLAELLKSLGGRSALPVARDD